MITIEEFINKYTGILVDTDGIYPGECMDLMHKFCQEVLGLSDLRILAAPTAIDVFTNFNNIFGHEYFEKIVNFPDGIPQKGDIIFFKTAAGAGHVCIYINGNANTFNSFDQNWPLGSLPHVQFHTYVGVVGWLRLKNINVVQSPKMPDYLVQLFNTQGIDYQNEGAVRELFGHANDYPHLKQDLENCQAQLTLQQQNNATLQSTNSHLADQLISLKDQLSKVQNDLLNSIKQVEPATTPIPVVTSDPSGFWAFLDKLKKFLGIA